jgi:arylsulfatase A-like enzyme
MIAKLAGTHGAGWIARAALGGVALLVAACAPAAVSEGGSVLVIVVDELRADHCSLMGYDRETTPKLDALAQQGVVFEQAFTTAPWGVPAHMALLTGCDPGIAERYLPPGAPGALALRWRLPSGAPSLAEEMLRAGLSTAAFVDTPMIGPALGFTRGFQEFSLVEPRDVRGPEDYGARGVLTRLSRWLGERRRGERWFAYVQLSDLTRVWGAPDPAWDRRFEPREELDHAPPVVDLPSAFFAIPRRRWYGAYSTLAEYEARYDGALAKLDAELGALFEDLRARRDFGDVTLVVASAHGVSFGEGGVYVDHGALTDADLRSLLVVRPADRLAEALRGRRESGVASLIDVAPTLLELIGVEPPRGMQGLSWRAALDASAGAPPDRAERRVFAHFARQDGFAAMDARFSYAWTRPWISDPAYLQRQWYGGPIPGDPQPLEILRDRAQPGAQPDDAAERSAALHAAGRAWLEEVEAARRRYNSTDWTEALSLLPPPAEPAQPPSSTPDSPPR